VIIFIYGLDLSLSNSGVTILDPDTYEPVYVGSISTKGYETRGQKLKYIQERFIELKNKYPPSLIVLEKGFSKFNKETHAIQNVVGVVLCIFHNIDFIEYMPKTIKATIVHGNASKDLVRKVIQKNFPELQFEDNDQSDSYAIALTYLIKNKYIKWSKSVLNKERRKI
jgi:Holliday junction resolvasome RuvABC endonuclease subunit